MTNKDQHPAILYKYIDTTGGLSMLQKEELWFRRTGFLNDPYDCYLSHECQGKYPEFSVSFDLWKIQCKMPPKTKRFYPLVPK